MRIGKIASSAEYQMDEQFQNLPIFKFQTFWKFVNFLIWKIKKISRVLQFRKSNLYLRQSHKTIEFLQLFNFEN